jgi:hypothetical protein
MNYLLLCVVILLIAFSLTTYFLVTTLKSTSTCHSTLVNSEKATSDLNSQLVKLQNTADAQKIACQKAAAAQEVAALASAEAAAVAEENALQQAALESQAALTQAAAQAATAQAAAIKAAAEAATTATTAADRQTYIKYASVSGVDYPNIGDLVSSPSTTAADCQTKCNNNIQCVGAVTDGNTCWLKSQLGNATMNGAVTGVLPIGTTAVPGMNYGGHDIRDKNITSVADCRAYYQSTNGAVGALFNGNHCWTKSALVPSRPDPGITLVL